MAIWIKKWQFGLRYGKLLLSIITKVTKMTNNEVGRVVTKEHKLEHLVITKTNKLAQAGNDLTVLEAKILEYCFANIFKGDSITSHDVFEVDIATMTEYFGLQRGHAYRELKQVFLSLARKQLKIEFADTKIVSSWLSAIRYNDTQGILQIQLSPIVCDHVSIKLLNTEYFTQYHLTEVSGLKYKFSNTLYNYLKSYSYKKDVETKVVISLENLRELFLLDETEYLLYADLKRQLEKCLKEISEKTGLIAKLLERKTGKKVTELVFVVITKGD